MVGTKDFAVPTFMRLLDSGWDVAALVTQPERPQGRRQELIPSRIKTLAQERGVHVEQPQSINAAEFVEVLRTIAPDVLVTAAYGQILSPEVLAVPRLGGVNLHGSILPAYRGAAPVARAIQAGETETGVTVIQMSPRVDAGGMLAVARTSIGEDETAGALEARLAELGAPLVVDTLARLFSTGITPIEQDRSRVSKAPKLTRADSRMDWKLPARRLHNLVRALNPWPLASAEWQPVDTSADALRLIVHRSQVVEHLSGAPGEVLDASGSDLTVATGEGALRLLAVQLPGKKPMLADAFLRGHKKLQAGRFV